VLKKISVKNISVKNNKKENLFMTETEVRSGNTNLTDIRTLVSVRNNTTELGFSIARFVGIIILRIIFIFMSMGLMGLTSCYII